MTTQGIDDHARSSTEFSNPVIRWIDYRLPIFTFRATNCMITRRLGT